MTTYFSDSSAVIKRYVTETGSGWMKSLMDPDSGHLMTVSRITTVEVPAGLARRRRQASISESIFKDALTAFRRDTLLRFRLIEVDTSVCDIAQELVIRHPLRAYDAVQLASAVAVNRALIATNLSPVTFLCADARLISVARAEGLAADDPNLHP